MNDDFTMALRLCDDDGMVSNERADPQPGPFLNLTYLDIHRNLQAHTRPNTCALVVDPFFCTGSAHLAGEHIRCTSPAHDRDLLGGGANG